MAGILYFYLDSVLHKVSLRKVLISNEPLPLQVARSWSHYGLQFVAAMYEDLWRTNVGWVLEFAPNLHWLLGWFFKFITAVLKFSNIWTWIIIVVLKNESIPNLYSKKNVVFIWSFINTVGYDLKKNRNYKFLLFWKCSKPLALEVLCSQFVFENRKWKWLTKLNTYPILVKIYLLEVYGWFIPT